MDLTPAIVRYRLSGARRGADGRPTAPNKVHSAGAYRNKTTPCSIVSIPSGFSFKSVPASKNGFPPPSTTG